jgi:tyrosine-protein phosphatase SIW14
VPKAVSLKYPGRIPPAALLALIVFGTGFCRTSPPVEPRLSSWAQAVPSKALKNWYRLDDNVYRSEQPNREGFVEIRDHGIRTVLNLRAHHSDEAMASSLNLTLVSVPMTARRFTEDDVIAALKAIQSAPKPVLIHCRYGADRTGVVSAMYRIVFQGWTRKKALEELLGGGFGFHLQYKNIPRFIREIDLDRIKKELGIFPAPSLLTESGGPGIPLALPVPGQG